jgi:anti-anti-sigma factor
MPSDPHTFLITVTVMPERRRTDLVLSGDIDLAARPLLCAAVDQIAAAAPHTTVIDLAAVTFGGSDLASFLARVRTAIPAGSLLVVSGPTPMTRKVLQFTGIERIAIIRDDVYAR